MIPPCIFAVDVPLSALILLNSIQHVENLSQLSTAAFLSEEENQRSSRLTQFHFEHGS